MVQATPDSFLPDAPSAIPAPGALAAVRRAEWCPGTVAEEVPHAEIFTRGGEATGAALALAFARDRMRAARPDPVADVPDERMWLWVQDREALSRSGRPYRPGLPRGLRHRLIHVAAASAEDALFALEEGLRCRDLAFVVGEIAGNPRALDFTASRRLSLAAERHGVPFWLVRIDAKRDLSSARMRWEAAATPSPPPRWNPQAPGTPSWHAELFRARRHPPGTWTMHDDDMLAAERPASAASKPRTVLPHGLFGAMLSRQEALSRQEGQNTRAETG
jgi:protein ImuA